MVPVRVDPLLHPMGTAGGHRLVLLSLEVHEDWADLRFARTETPGAPPLPRRIPHARAWTVVVDGETATVVDAVGRGDRAFSNGEVRFRPPPREGAHLEVTVDLVAGSPALRAVLDLPSPRTTAATSGPGGAGSADRVDPS